MANTDNQRPSSTIKIVLFVAFSLGVVACIYIISQGKMSDRESAMLGILVTILSVLASWIITEMYGTAQHAAAIHEVREEYRNNLRTYALKAAEKVNNLSNELHKLSIYLEEELNYTDYRSVDEELLAKEERIESAIHLIRTLKSVNDTSLSDWEGVIGDELDQQREEQAEKEEALKHLVDRVQSLIEDQRQDHFGGKDEATSSVRHEVEELKRELRLATLQLSESKIPKRLWRPVKQDVEGECPICHKDIRYMQKPSVKSVKQVVCSGCQSKLLSTYDEDHGFSLSARKVESLVVDCAHCGAQSTVPLDNFPSASVLVSCTSCGHSFRISRTLTGVDVVPIPQPSSPAVPAPIVVSEETVELVRKALPPQPWPTGIHHKVSKQLGLSAAEVRRATQVLIKRGDFHHQIDGVVYVPAEELRGAGQCSSGTGARE